MTTDRTNSSLTRNPQTGWYWQPGELEAAIEKINAMALKSRGTADLPEDAGRDSWTGMWRDGR